MNNSRPDRNTWHRRIQKLGYFGLALLAINFTYQVWHRYIDPRPAQLGRSACDLHKKPCTVVLSDDRRVKFGLDPKKFTASQPLTMNLELTNFKPDNVYLTVSPLSNITAGRNIDLVSNGHDAFSTKVQLNEINAAQKDWLLLVHIQQGDQNIAIPFKLKNVSS